MGKRHQDRSGNRHKHDNYEMTQEGLDEYIRVSRPSVLVVIISLVVVLAAVIIWGFVGTLPVTETVTGVVVDYSVYEQINAAALEEMKEGKGLTKAATSGKETESAAADPSAEDTANAIEAESSTDMSNVTASEDKGADAAANDDGTEQLNEEIIVFCFLDASRYNGQAIADFGEEAVLKMPDQTTFKGTVESRFLEPVSKEQAKEILFENDWVLDQCIDQNYSWWLIIRPKEDISKYTFMLTEVTLLTEEVAPIQFLMK